MRRAVFGMIVMGLLAAVAPVAQQRPQEIALQAAMRTETVSGDLKGAIGEYQAIVTKYASDRATVAMALVRMAECHEKLGQSEAKAIYQRVLSQYADQKEAADMARARLGDTKLAVDRTGVVNRQVWVGSDVDPLGTVSPDGRYLSFVAWDTGDLAVRELATGMVRRLTSKGTWTDSSDFAEESAISRDGTRVAYSWYNDKTSRYDLRVLGLDAARAGTPKVLLDNPDIVWLAPYDWSPDGRLVAVQVARKDQTSQIGLVDTEGGSFKPLKTVDWDGTTRMFLSPDGSLVAYDLPQKDGSRPRDVFVMSVDGSRELKAVEHPAYDVVLGWSPDGRSVLFGSDRGGSLGLWSVAIHDGKVARPVNLKPDLGHLVASLGVTRAGALLYGVRTSAATIAIGPVDFESGKLLSEPVYPFEGYLTVFRQPDWSLDGERILVTSGRATADLTGRMTNLTIYSVNDGRSREIRTMMGYIGRPRWAPDGSITVLGSDQNGRQGIYRIDPESGASTAIVVGEPGVRSLQPCWLPDGRSFVYRRAEEDKVTILVRNAASGEERKLVEGKFLLGLTRSPDGRQITYIERAEKSSSLNVMSVAGGPSRELQRVSGSTALTNLVEWTPDARHVIFGKREGNKGSTWIVPVAGGTARQLDPSFPTTPTLRIHPDGRQIVYETGTNAMEIWALENFLPVEAGKR